VGSEYWFSAILMPFLIFALAALGLNILTGYAGQLSLGTAAFMAVGPTRPTTSAARRGHSHRATLRSLAARGGWWACVRAAVAAHQGLLPGRGHAGGAVLRGVGADQVSLVLQQQFLGRDQRKIDFFGWPSIPR
jgi:hypothetical protein